jgi:protoporphyrinogen oxidase
VKDDCAAVHTVIIGAGGAGLSAAYHLADSDCLLLEQSNYVGGTATTWEVGGYLFDSAIHVFYTNDSYVRSLVTQLLKGRLLPSTRKAFIHYRDRETEYPLQSNLRGQHLSVIADCLFWFILERFKHLCGLQRAPSDFEQWTLNTFGRGFTKHFGRPFNLKNWTVPLSDMSHRWVSRRVPVPSLKEVIVGALKGAAAPFGPNAQFLYPEFGGYKTICDALAAQLPAGTMHLSARVTRVCLTDKTVTVEGGSPNSRRRCVYRYENLVSSMPLPALVSITDEVPPIVREAARQLKWNKICLVSLGIKRPQISDKHWIQFPEPQFPFYRVSFPSNLSPTVAPPGRSSVTAEIAMSTDSPVDEAALFDKTKRGLLDCGLLRADDVIEVQRIDVLEPGYVIPTRDKEEMVEVIQVFLRGHGVFSLGRFGAWEYLNIDHAIKQGKEAADSIRFSPEAKRHWLDSMIERVGRDFQRAQARDACPPPGSDSDAITPISQTIIARLRDVSPLIAAGEIEPFANFRISPDRPDSERTLREIRRPVRAGVLAVTGNPFHWGHVDIALKAIRLYRLDTVVYICQGLGDYKPGMLDREVRHEMVKRGISDFYPLLRYSPIGYDNSLLGESNFFEFAALNSHHAVKLHYVFGSEKLARIIDDFNDLVDRYKFKLTEAPNAEVALAVVNRGAVDGKAKQHPACRIPVLQLDVERDLPLSSSALRQSVTAGASPGRVVEYLTSRGLYGLGPHS